MSWTIA